MSCNIIYRNCLNQTPNIKNTKSHYFNSKCDGADQVEEQLISTIIIIIKLGLNVALTYQNRSYRDSETKEK